MLLSLVQCFYLFLCFFKNSSSGSCYLIPFYNIALKLPNAFLKQGSKGIQNHHEGCSLGLFLSRLRWVPQGPRPSSISTQPTHLTPRSGSGAGQLTSSSGRCGPRTRCVRDRPGRCSTFAGAVRMRRDPGACFPTSASV